MNLTAFFFKKWDFTTESSTHDRSPEILLSLTFLIVKWKSSFMIRQLWAFQGGTVVKNLPAIQETQETRVQSVGQEDPLEEEMATHSSILAWRISWTEQPGRLQSIESQRIGCAWATKHAKHPPLDSEQTI